MSALDPVCYRGGMDPTCPPPGIDWPAWVQAVGSVIGIAIAIAVPWWSERKRQLLVKLDEREARNRARANVGVANSYVERSLKAFAEHDANWLRREPYLVLKELLLDMRQVSLMPMDAVQGIRISAGKTLLVRACTALKAGEGPNGSAACLPICSVTLN